MKTIFITTIESGSDGVRAIRAVSLTLDEAVTAIKVCGFPEYILDRLYIEEFAVPTAYCRGEPLALYDETGKKF